MFNKTSLLIPLLFATACFAQPAATAPQRTVSTSGSATIYVQPDEVDLRFEIHTFDKDLAKAKADNDAASAAILKLLKELGVEEKHIQTERMRADAVYEERVEDRRMKRGDLQGYSVGRSYAVLLKDVSKFEPLSDALLTDSRCTMGGFDFRTSELRKHRDEARRKAMLAARDKARLLAETLDCTVGAPVSITESSERWGFGGGRFSNVSQNFSSDAAGPADDGESAIKLGQIAVSADVSVTFELSPIRP